MLRGRLSRILAPPSARRPGRERLVVDLASVEVDRRARRAKTDHIDAERLLRSLMTYLRGEPKVWSMVRMPSVAEEDDRRLHRERDRLIPERIQHVNHIKGLCAVHGICTTSHCSPIGRGGCSSCVLVTDARCRRGSRQRSHGNYSYCECSSRLMRSATPFHRVACRSVPTQKNPRSRQTQSDRTGDCHGIDRRTVVPPV